MQYVLNEIYFTFYKIIENYHVFISECPINSVPILCQNYTSCIPAEKLCDGIDDCGDNIDETTEMCKY